MRASVLVGTLGWHHSVTLIGDGEGGGATVATVETGRERCSKQGGRFTFSPTRSANGVLDGPRGHSNCAPGPCDHGYGTTTHGPLGHVICRGGCLPIFRMARRRKVRFRHLRGLRYETIYTICGDMLADMHIDLFST